jgi:hypothetical protein
MRHCNGVTRPMLHRLARIVFVLAAGFLAVACGESNLVRDAAIATGLGAKPVEPAGFVKQSRRGGGDYMPIGVAAPKRDVNPRSTADAKKLEESLEAQRATNDAAAAAAKAAAAGSAPAPKPAGTPDN